MKRLATSVLAAAAIGAAAQAGDAKPRLVVGIVVDQLRTDYIEHLRDYFGERGFKTLLTEGVYMPDVEFKPSRLDAVSGTSMVMTGAYPSQNGVASAYVYDTGSAAGAPGTPAGVPTLRPVLTDGSSTTLTNDSFTPAAIALTTLADELAVASGGTSQIYSVAADPQQAIALSGHAGKGAFWINNTSGNWATTGYYGAMPAAVSNRNFRQSIPQRLDTMRWTPLPELARLDLPGPKKAIAFKHTFPRQDRDVYRKFIASPLGNAEVTDVAIDLLSALNLGATPGQTDMLNVGYTLAPFKYTATSANGAELADAYLRLDKQLARLSSAIERQAGAGNAIIWLTSTGYFDDAMVEPDKRYRLPGGDFSARKARSLLNSYLSAKYGSGEYIASIRDGQVYFDRRTLDRPGATPSSVITDARTFLVKMSGVSEAFTLDEILSATDGDGNALRLSLDPATAGDIIINFTPGWEVHYDEQTPPLTQMTASKAVMTPAFIIAPGVAARKIDTPVEATALAPTLAGQLRIRSPNGARHRGISL